jgi:hypothetical protein
MKYCLHRLSVYLKKSFFLAFGSLGKILEDFAYVLWLQLFEMDPEVGAYIEYTFGDGVHAMPTSLYVLEKMQPQVFYNMSPSEVRLLFSHVLYCR